jgi:hypothetical protein
MNAYLKADHHTARIRQAQETVGRMLRYAIGNPQITVSEDLINRSVKSLYTRHEDFSAETEILLWTVYAQLSQLISPVTDVSIQIADGLKNTAATVEDTASEKKTLTAKLIRFFGLNSHKSLLVKRCQQDLGVITFCLLMFVSFYVVSQCYIALLSETLTHSSQLLDDLKAQKTAELLLNEQSPANQNLQIRNEILTLYLKLDAASQALSDLVMPLERLGFLTLSESTLSTLKSCARYRDTIDPENADLLRCVALERKYASATYTVLSRYVLPLLLGFIGATAYVTRHTLFQLATNSYAPSPHGMMTMRLCLGGLLGAISGIFISADANETQGFNLNLTLMSLTMGYSIEVAFSLFDSGIDRIKEWTKSLRAPSTANPTVNDIPSAPPK